MKAMVWFRVSAVLLVLFALGHTVGFLSFRGTTAEAQAVRAQQRAHGRDPGMPPIVGLDCCSAVLHDE